MALKKLDKSKGKSVFLTREEKKVERENKRLERERKREEREAKKLARLEKQRIMKLPAKKMSAKQIDAVIGRMDPDGKFSDKKKTALRKRIKQIGELKPGAIANRLRARQAQVDMIRYIFEEVAE